MVLSQKGSHCFAVFSEATLRNGILQKTSEYFKLWARTSNQMKEKKAKIRALPWHPNMKAITGSKFLGKMFDTIQKAQLFITT